MVAASETPARSRRKVLSVLAGMTTTCALVLLPAAGASAHDYLVESTPVADSVQTTVLDQVSLTFNDRVLDLTGDGSSALLQLTDSANRHFETGCPSILDRTVTAPVALGAPGRYTIEWQIVSADGHTVSNAISFTYRPPAGTPSAAGSTSRPDCGGMSTAVPSGTAAPAAPTATVSGADRGLGLVIGIAVGIVVIALAGVLIAILTSRRRLGRPDPDDV